MRFEPKEQTCPRCGIPSKVQKSRTRRLVTNSHDGTITEIIRYCLCDGSKFVSEKLRKLTPPRSPYSYALIARIGYLRYRKHRQISEIQEEFAEKGIKIPRTTLQRLCLRFLKYFIAVHLESFPHLSALINYQGGYIFQIDGTQNHDRGTIVLVKDTISGIRLFAKRFSSESKENLIPFLRDIKSTFGTPLAIIRDGGDGIVKSLSEVFPNTHQIYCHFHFLRALGHALFDYHYKRFKKMIYKLGVKGGLKKLYRLLKKRLGKRQKPFIREVLEELESLLHSVLTYSGEGLGYPFELPVLRVYERCLAIEEPVSELIRRCADHLCCIKVLCKVQDTLRLLHPPPAVRGKLHRDAERLQEREEWFGKARKALRWQNGPIPLSTEIRWSDKELASVRKGIDDFLAEVESAKKDAISRKARSLAAGIKIIEKRFTEHKETLLAPNIQVETAEGKRIIKVDRTNNGIEQDFRRCRRHGRRIQGDKNVEGIVQREGVGLVLLLNMGVPGYVESVFGSWELMGERFGRVGEEALIWAGELLEGYNPWWAL